MDLRYDMSNLDTGRAYPIKALGLAFASNNASRRVDKDIVPERVDTSACILPTDNHRYRPVWGIRPRRRRTRIPRYRRGGGTPALQGCSLTEWDYSKPLVPRLLTDLQVPWVDPSLWHLCVLDIGV